MPSPVPALDKALTALATALGAGASLAGITIATDKPEDQPFGNAELDPGAINIIHTATDFSQITPGETLHRAAVDLDMLVSVDDTATIAARLRLLEANIVGTIYADRTLGGVVQDVELVNAGGTQDVRADEGGRVLSILILFLTPFGDHFTVLGASGPIP